MQPAYHPKWLQPITIEAIVKRLNVELKAARLQANDLKHTASFVDAVATNERSPPPPISSSLPHKSLDGYKHAQNSPPPPPGPPPTQPLPEAPSSTSTNGSLRAKLNEIQPLLRRDTEKPKHSPIKSAGEKLQIRNLVDALTTAQREIAAQGEKLKLMQDTLEQERLNRKNAEVHDTPAPNGNMTSVQGSSLKVHTSEETKDLIPAHTVSNVTELSIDSEADVPRLHSIITTMRSEMNALRTQLASAQRRAEEAEDASRRDRKTLIEMVESIKQREERVRKRKEAKRAFSSAHSTGHLDEKTKHSHFRSSSSGSSSDEDEFLDFEDAYITSGEMDHDVQKIKKHGNALLGARNQQRINGAVSAPPSVTHLQHLGKSAVETLISSCLLYTSPSPRDGLLYRMPSSA